VPENRILDKMLDRLYASLARGPSLNSRPHSSRQRVDLMALAGLGDVAPNEVLKQLLGGSDCKLAANVPMPSSLKNSGLEPWRVAEVSFQETETEISPEEQAAVKAWRAQKSLLQKLRNLSEDARTYEQDTGVHALALGYPLLSLPPGVSGGTRRILAPLAFVPITLEVNASRRPGCKLTCRGEGVDMVIPNAALMAWIERESGASVEDLFEDEEGEDPWREIREIIETVTKRLDLDASLGAGLADPAALELVETPRADELPAAPALLRSAVIGLFPASNQGLLRDTREMIAAPSLDGPVASFLDLAASLEAPDLDEADREPDEVARVSRNFETERFVAAADPFQGGAVASARVSRALVIHGPPGTGKSQTITNIIGDHLARGERVLFVCDKRTALDVVANRLDHLGLGRFCAVVHDSRRDQRELYMSVRKSLEELADVRTNEQGARDLKRSDTQLQSIHDELEKGRAALMEAGGDDMSFHQLMGRWISLSPPAVDGLGSLDDIAPGQLDDARRTIEVALDRARSVSFPTNPWATAVGCGLDHFMGRPVESIRRGLASCVEDARAADHRRDERIVPFDAQQPLDEQAKRRAALRSNLAETLQKVADPTLAKVAALEPDEAKRRFTELKTAMEPYRGKLRPLDRELKLSLSAGLPPLGGLNRDIGSLAEYIESSEKWWGGLAFGAKQQASRVLRPYGLAREPGEASRLREFLVGLRARILLSRTLRELQGVPEPATATILDDDELAPGLAGFERALETRELADADPGLSRSTRAALVDPEGAPAFLEGLRLSGPRAESLATLEQALKGLELLDGGWRAQMSAHTRAGHQAGDTLRALEAAFDSVEAVLRVRDGLDSLPAGLCEAVGAVVSAGLEPADGIMALQREVLAAELGRRVRGNQHLARLDGERISHALHRYAVLEREKRAVVRDVIVHRWVERQRERLLAGTRTRLNGEGAGLRRRLFVRGRRAMRLRQVIANGEKEFGEEHGDPLFDMCPVWMASPETVAQIFPRRALFDVVVFDEASQCRLEEALPVLTRAKRAVIAGDPKQLPPTRFFEASIATSEDKELETEQDLFEAQQGEVEDLLAAALNLAVDEAYLDVHYRSRNSDLIEFSNRHFYRSRLQPIPGHPSNRALVPPLRIDRADGIYEDRCNPTEAQRVCAIVADLLRRAEPPSIGIACFNLKQRDLIRDLLDDLSIEDHEFGTRLKKARVRRGEGSFQGLFVKNLENVQGDERDHIIISTTYGPTKEGRFYRRFGPLGRAGGGRRLNVLVTRAREEVHLVTSIPREAYASIDAVPDGLAPNGGWLLFAYLRWAEELQQLYETHDQERAAARQGDDIRFVERPIPPHSDFALGLGAKMTATRGQGVDAHWGNPGFCIDVALHHPDRDEDVTAGLLCDFARYDRAPDPLQWEVFRTAMLESQGWHLHRVWTPSFFRDPDRELRAIEAAGEAAAVAQGGEAAAEG